MLSKYQTCPVSSIFTTALQYMFAVCFLSSLPVPSNPCSPHCNQGICLGEHTRPPPSLLSPMIVYMPLHLKNRSLSLTSPSIIWPFQICSSLRPYCLLLPLGIPPTLPFFSPRHSPSRYCPYHKLWTGSFLSSSVKHLHSLLRSPILSLSQNSFSHTSL